MSIDQLGMDIAAGLNSLGHTDARAEYPALVEINRPERILIFGFVNGPLGWDLHTDDWEWIQSGQSTLTSDAPLQQLVAYADSVIRNLQSTGKL